MEESPPISLVSFKNKTLRFDVEPPIPARRKSLDVRRSCEDVTDASLIDNDESYCSFCYSNSVTPLSCEGQVPRTRGTRITPQQLWSRDKMDDKKQLHDNKDSISCAGSSGGCSDSTVSATMESSVEGTHQGHGCDNDAFETSGDLSPSPLSSSLPRTPPRKTPSTTVNMELAEFTSGKNSNGIEDLTDTGSTNGQVGEYFISINEHKKGIRSEKLYVTKDNRPNRDRGVGVRKCIGWSIGLIFVIAAVTIGALVGVGVIDPKPERFLGHKDGRSRDILREEDPHFGEVIANGVEVTNSIDQETESHGFPEGYVPNVYNGQFKITNVAWDPRLADMTSEMYQELSSKVKSSLEEILLPYDFTNAAKFYIAIKDFQPGSVVVNFRLGWVQGETLTHNGHEHNDLLGMDDHNDNGNVINRDVLFRRFSNALQSSNGRIGPVYTADPSTFALNFVLNRCHEMKCGGSCQYSYEQSDFFCTCPENFFLNSDSISCVLIEEEKMESASNIFSGSTTTKKTTTAMITMDYPFSEYDEQTEAEDTTDTDVKTSLPAESLDTSSTTIRPETPSNTNEQDLDSTPRIELEVEQTTTRHNHSVHWLTEEGDIMVPVTNDEHEMTTLVKIGNIESETESGSLSEATTTASEVKDSDDLTTERSTISEVSSEAVEQEESTEPEVRATETHLKDNSNPSVEWTTEDLSTANDESVTVVPEIVRSDSEETVATDEPVETASQSSSNNLEEVTPTAIPEATFGQTTTSPTVESSTTQIEISFSLPDNKEMLEEVEEKLKSVIDQFADEMSSTTQGHEVSSEESHVAVEVTESEDDATTRSPIQIEPRENNLDQIEETKPETLTTTTTTSTPVESNQELENDSLLERTSENPQTTDAIIEISGLRSDLDSEALGEVLKETLTNVTRDFEETSTQENSSIVENSSSEQNKIVLDVSTEETIPSSQVDESTPGTQSVDIDQTNSSDIATANNDLSTETSSFSSSTTTELVSQEIVDPQTRPKKHSDSPIQSAIENTLVSTDAVAVICEQGQFQCRDGSCVSKYQRCDLIQHCVDGSDEDSCDSMVCETNDYSCGTGDRCLPLSKRCDGHLDCINGQDEDNCHTACDEKEFYCRGQGRCLPARLRCDGVADCTSGEDEHECSCQPSEIQCKISGGCIQSSQVCDGHVDCPDSSDEWDCLKLSNGDLQVRSSDGGWHSVCSSGWTESWSNMACHQMGFNQASGFSNKTEAQPVTQAFMLNSTLFHDEVSLIQSARSNDQEVSCGETVNLECQAQECGKWSVSDDLELAISTGSAQSSQLPAIAYLVHLDKRTSCTVTIIHPKWLLTSFSCLAPYGLEASNWIALDGTSGGEDSSSESGTQIRPVKRFIVHPKAKSNRGFFQNDLALVELADSFSMSEKVNTVCLAENEPISDQYCLTAGWHNVGANETVSINQYVESVAEPTLNIETCNSTTNYNGFVHESVFCSGARSSRVSCKNESGASLLCRNSEGFWELYGVLTREGQCLSRPLPDLFSSISKFKSWIDNTVGRTN